MISSEELSKYIKIKAIEMCADGKSSHIGSVLSCADLLAVLYSGVLKYNSKQPRFEGRDRFLMSKGHAGAVFMQLSPSRICSRSV